MYLLYWECDARILLLILFRTQTNPLVKKSSAIKKIVARHYFLLHEVLCYHKVSLLLLANTKNMDPHASLNKSVIYLFLLQQVNFMAKDFGIISLIYSLV